MAGSDKDQYAEVFEEGHSGTEHSVHQRMRANSSIMQLKKILGGAFLHVRPFDGNHIHSYTKY